jgi:hypothetical protein
VTRHETPAWVAFAAGAAVMLVLGLLVFAWTSQEPVRSALRTLGVAARVLPDLGWPQPPSAPRLPDAPTPRPR